MQLEIIVMSKAGGRAVNEDACGFWTTPEACFCALSDGLGGHYGGDVASKLAVQHALDRFREAPECSTRAVEGSLQAANFAIMNEQQRDVRLKHMRATAVILSIDTKNCVAIWGHIGDSRLYCFRQGRIVKQTRDHSVLQSMVDAGYLQPKELRTSPNRSKLLAALGNEEQFNADILSAAFPLLPGDVFLLCTDGLWEYVEEEDMERTLGAAISASDWLKALERQVLALGHKGQDNYSAIAVWCSDPDVTPQFGSQHDLPSHDESRAC
ncbi:MAG: protein phosphatase 2C domain-containing protein [Nitrosospira sp.]